VTDFLDILFTSRSTPEEVEAGLAAGRLHEAARLSALATQPSKQKTLGCPRCGGSGYIAAFQHYKAGACFTCGGTGARS